MKTAVLLALLYLTTHSPVKPDADSQETKSKGNNGRETSIVSVGNHALNDETEHKKDKAPPWYTSVEWANWALVFVGASGVIYACKTVKAVQKQGDLMIASERAWISIKTDMATFNPTAADAHYHFHWRIQNTGKSVAELISTDARCLIWNGYDTLPELPEFGNTQITFNGRILAPNESYPPVRGYFEHWENGVYSMHDLNVSFDAAPDTLYLLAFGRVRYRTFGQDRESNFVEDYTWVKSEPIPTNGFRPHLAAPRAYTQHT